MPVDRDTLLAELLNAVDEGEPRLAVKTVLDRTLANGELREMFGEPVGGLHVLHNSPDLTVLNLVCAPGVLSLPHDHRMWAAIGVYEGREENAFFRRDGRSLTASGGNEVEAPT
jgi:predicted metal-dependent enzyme (double-stranded beta helix superfamily)